MIHQAAQGAMDLKASPGNSRRTQEPRPSGSGLTQVPAFTFKQTFPILDSHQCDHIFRKP